MNVKCVIEVLCFPALRICLHAPAKKKLITRLCKFSRGEKKKEMLILERWCEHLSPVLLRGPGKSTHWHHGPHRIPRPREKPKEPGSHQSTLSIRELYLQAQGEEDHPSSSLRRLYKSILAERFTTRLEWFRPSGAPPHVLREVFETAKALIAPGATHLVIPLRGRRRSIFRQYQKGATEAVVFDADQLFRVVNEIDLTQSRLERSSRPGTQPTIDA